MPNNEIPVFNWNALPVDYPDQYEGLNRRYSHIYKSAADHLVSLAVVEPGNLAIDVGAGTGISTESIAEAAGPSGRLLALEPSLPMLERASGKIFPCGVEWAQGGAEDLVESATDASFLDCDVILSSFTYYYTYQSRTNLHRAAYKILRPGGRWAFNLTKYLGEMKINGRWYNSFGKVYVDHLRSTLARHHIEPAEENAESSEQFTDTSWESQQLRTAGFDNVHIEAWQLPLSPSEAFRFTLDGFYRHGSMVTFLPSLMSIPIAERIELLDEALASCADELDSYEPPHIANFVAQRPAR
ncbi:class I SAM-dependent methyltransferase [Nocardia sp. NBC_00403]|uniref:class I SAM-dependent methyltransferase n=1 Tax=Nocardia sp. NBC_00403 TaxID=2975990 RepID=UPI002E1A4CEF